MHYWWWYFHHACKTIIHHGFLTSDKQLYSHQEGASIIFKMNVHFETKYQSIELVIFSPFCHNQTNNAMNSTQIHTFVAILIILIYKDIINLTLSWNFLKPLHKLIFSIDFRLWYSYSINLAHKGLNYSILNAN